MSLRQLGLIAAAAAALLSVPVAQAAEKGDLFFRLGATNIDPDDDNGFVRALDLDLEVDDDTSITFTGSYMFTDNFAVELLAATPFEHDIKVDTLGKVGSVKHLPPTLSAQWHFWPDKQITPYVGAGINWTLFFDEDTSGALSDGDIDVDSNSFGPALQAGVDIDINEQWFVNFDFRYIKIDTEADITIPGVGREDVDVDIDPNLYGFHVGYRFR